MRRETARDAHFLVRARFAEGQSAWRRRRVRVTGPGTRRALDSSGGDTGSERATAVAASTVPSAGSGPPGPRQPEVHRRRRGPSLIAMPAALCRAGTPPRAPLAGGS